MKIMARLGAIVAAGLVSVSLGEAQPLKYLGRQGEVPTGWIEFGHEKYYEIGAGTEIPAWGHVKEVRDDRIVVEQVRTEAEKRGMIEIHILREDLRLLPSTPIPVR